MKAGMFAGLGALLGLVIGCGGGEDPGPGSSTGSAGGGGAGSSTQTGSSTGTAGGGGSAGAAYWQSGSRLRAETDDADGAARFRAFLDTQTGEECQFAPTVEGKVRCLPLPRLEVHYKDALCAEPVALPLGEGCALPGMISDLDEHTCANEPLRIPYTLGAPLGMIQVYRVHRDGYCGMSGLHDAVDLAPTPLEGFVEATLSREPGGYDLDREILSGADGSRVLLDAYDSARELACAPVALFDGDFCLPRRSGVYPSPDFGNDSACMSGVGTVNGDASCGPPPFLLDTSYVTECTKVKVLDAVGPPVAEIWGVTGLGCSKIDPAEIDVTLYEKGVVESSSVLPTIVHEQVGSGLLRALLPTASNGTPVSLALRFFDVAREEECTVETFEDGSRHCVAQTDLVNPSFERFADDKCTERLATDPTWSKSWSVPPLRWVERNAAPTCGTWVVKAVWPITGSHDGPAYGWTKDLPKTCVPVQVFNNEQEFAIGPEESFDVYPRVDLVIE